MLVEDKLWKQIKMDIELVLAKKRNSNDHKLNSFDTTLMNFDDIPFKYRDVIQKCTWIDRLDVMHEKTAHAVVAVVTS